MTGGGFTVLDTGPNSHDSSRFSGVSRIRGPSWLHLPALTIGLLGISIVWSVEMAYASPYLLSLGLSKSAMSLTFLAGPLSGLVMQPVIGILADANTSKWGRRRPYMIVGTVLCVFAMMLLGWTKEIAGAFSSNMGLTLWLAVISVYLIDFSVNAAMATDRALLVDVLPSALQPSGNAWAARMAGFGSVAGYFAGNLDLPSLLPIFGHTELQILSVVVSIVLLGSHIITATTVSERVLLKNTTSGAGGPLAKSFTNDVKEMFENMWSLPRVIRQIFLIQFFSWISWFPVLFYSTLYIGDLYKRAFFATVILLPPPDISEETLSILDSEATRIGSRALFYSSILALFVNIVLPFFVTEVSSDSRRRKQQQLGNVHKTFSGGPRPWWQNFAVPEMLKIQLATLWAISQGILVCCMFATFFTSSVAGGTALVTITGFSWAVTQWAPFALLGEAILSEPSSVGADEVGGIRLVDTRSRSSMHRRGSSESQRELALLRGRRRSREDDARPNGEDTMFVPGDASDSESDAESDEEELTRAREKRDQRRKSLLGLTEAGVSSVNVTPTVPSYQFHDREEDDEDEDADEGAVLVGRSRLRDEEEGGEDDDSDESEHGGSGGLSAKAGIILGIHNVFIVIPQFLVTGLSSVIFALFDPARSVLHGPHPGGTLGPALNHTVSGDTASTLRSFILMARDADVENELEMIQELKEAATSNSIAYIFRVGGVSALVALVLCWRLARELRHR